MTYTIAEPCIGCEAAKGRPVFESRPRDRHFQA